MPNQYTLINDAVDRFAEVMKKKLRKKASEGWSGWDQDRYTEFGVFQQRLHRLVGRVLAGEPGEVVDVANFCMFVHEYLRRQKENPNA